MNNDERKGYLKGNARAWALNNCKDSPIHLEKMITAYKAGANEIAKIEVVPLQAENAKLKSENDRLISENFFLTNQADLMRNENAVLKSRVTFLERQ